MKMKRDESLRDIFNHLWLINTNMPLMLYSLYKHYACVLFSCVYLSIFFTTKPKILQL